MITQPLIVGVARNRKLHRVVASCYSRHIPVDLLHFAALEHISDRDGEEERDEDGSRDGEAHLVVFAVLVVEGLLTSILDEKTAVFSLVASVLGYLVRPKILAGEVVQVRLLSDGCSHGSLEADAVWLASYRSNKEQIVAVIAHEIGHYKKNHIIFNLLFSIIQTGIMLYILSLLIYMPIFSEALNIENHSFHIALVTFSILYTPISEISSIIFNLFSRKFEYEADEYADKSFDGKYLIQALKVLTKDSLSNLTPHPKYVWWHYSHPTLLERINQLQ